MTRLLVCAARVGVLGVLALCAFVLTPAAAAQSDRTEWEYCAIVSARSGTTPDQRYVGTVRVRYFADPSARDELIRVEGEQILAGSPVDSEVLQAMRLNALNRAIAKLGTNGWELVGEFRYAQTLLSDVSETHALYFKRQVAQSQPLHTARPN